MSETTQLTPRLKICVTLNTLRGPNCHVNSAFTGASVLTSRAMKKWRIAGAAGVVLLLAAGAVAVVTVDSGGGGDTDRAEAAAPEGAPRLRAGDVAAVVGEWQRANRVQEAQVDEAQEANCRDKAYADNATRPGGPSERWLSTALRSCTTASRSSSGGPYCSAAIASYRGEGVWECGAVRYDEQTGRIWYGGS